MQFMIKALDGKDKLAKSLKQTVDKQAQRKVQQTSHLTEGEKRVRGIKLKQGSPERL